MEFELDARARWDRLTEDDIRSIGFDAAQPARSTGRLKERLQARYAFDEQRADLELARFANRAFFDNMGPIADGRAIVQAPFFRSAPELSAAVPVLVGHTLNEGGGPNFFNTMREQWTDADLRLELSRRPNPVPDGGIDGLRQAYPRAKPVELYAHTVNQGGLAYRVDAVSLAAHKMVQNAAPAYLYVFAWKTRVLEGRPRAFHRSELPFVFDNTDRCAHQTGGTREARAMAAKVADAWIAFARTGSPRHSGLPEWPVFSSDRVPTMMFDDDCEVRYDHDRAARLAWESPRPSA